jgi:hypothetical protein
MHAAQNTEATLDGLGPMERKIAGMVISRLRVGQGDYGPWPTRDERDYIEETIEEAIDGMSYLAAELLRLKREASQPRIGMLRVYVCHRSSSSDRLASLMSMRRICRELVHEGVLPICPQLYLGNFVDEDIERDIALRLCQEMLKGCDEVRIYGRELTAGMRIEISFAEALGLPVEYVDATAEVP